ncbi:MAG TPA: VWA domain-containing protein [Telluria sp.]
MAEAEDVITDVARHATVFVQNLWRRHRQRDHARQLELGDVAPRLDLLINAVFGRGFRLRPAQAPAPRTWLDKLIRRNEAPPPTLALPATDGASIWLPRSFDIVETDADASERYRLLLLQQAMRAMRGSARHYPFGQSAALQACYHILEARAADDALVLLLPGILPSLQRLRATTLAARPAMGTLPAPLHAVERLVHAALSEKGAIPGPANAADVLAQARRSVSALAPEAQQLRGRLLVKDYWLGEFVAPPELGNATANPGNAPDDTGKERPRIGRLGRRPQVRKPVEGEDEQASPGPMMVQTAQPHEQAEDAMGMQRPTDRDTDTAADDFADSLSELPEARLVSTPGAAREVLLSDDPPEQHARNPAPAAHAGGGEVSVYPEWDWQSASYRDPGATVTLRTAMPGQQATVDAIFRRHAAMLQAIRRQFELLRAQRTRLRQQLDGDDIDIQGWIDNQAQRKAGGRLEQRLYETERRGRRDMAVTLLVDISGSTDGWVSGQCRVIDVEREALLMVCVALDGLGEPFSVLGFSGEGPNGVVVRAVKRFDENYSNDIALRIAGLEPENYTRTGAALRHASFELMTQAAEHKLLILLSDGRPNDVDQYDGRYGVEDLRQAVTEARLQGISPFCLTIDRQAANYLPAVFGVHSYALLQRAELLPSVLLGWLRKLVAA